MKKTLKIKYNGWDWFNKKYGISMCNGALKKLYPELDKKKTYTLKLSDKPLSIHDWSITLCVIHKWTGFWYVDDVSYGSLHHDMIHFLALYFPGKHRLWIRLK